MEAEQIKSIMLEMNLYISNNSKYKYCPFKGQKLLDQIVKNKKHTKNKNNYCSQKAQNIGTQLFKYNKMQSLKQTKMLEDHCTDEGFKFLEDRRSLNLYTPNSSFKNGKQIEAQRKQQLSL